jgi:cob(I)alamin adenosyltransferase
VCCNVKSTPFSLKIYTKTGDNGETSLFGGNRVKKDHLRVEAYGTIDELNAFMGLLADALTDEPATQAFLHSIQHRLFSIGAHLATDPDTFVLPADIVTTDVAALEQHIDTMNEVLPELRHFILPGGHPSVSLTHVCRTVCRRSERQVVALAQKTEIEPVVLNYLNRLSDYFFVLARWIGHRHQAAEVIWQKR